ncbi:hypothetical protein N7534_005194 [Penicillium rubens]|nr:hypothetical protein N7534_005194 [Penicillium rubens]
MTDSQVTKEATAPKKSVTMTRFSAHEKEQMKSGNRTAYVALPKNVKAKRATKNDALNKHSVPTERGSPSRVGPSPTTLGAPTRFVTEKTEAIPNEVLAHKIEPGPEEAIFDRGADVREHNRPPKKDCVREAPGLHEDGCAISGILSSSSGQRTCRPRATSASPSTQWVAPCATSWM